MVNGHQLPRQFASFVLHYLCCSEDAATQTDREVIGTAGEAVEAEAEAELEKVLAILRLISEGTGRSLDEKIASCEKMLHDPVDMAMFETAGDLFGTDDKMPLENTRPSIHTHHQYGLEESSDTAEMPVSG